MINPITTIDSTLPKIERPYSKVQTAEYDCGFPSPIQELDTITGGWHDQGLVIIGGRPSSGKSAFAIDCALHAAESESATVMYFSLEMSAIQLVKRMMKNVVGNLDEEEQWPEMEKKLKVLAGRQIFINDTPGISIEDLTETVRNMKKSHGVEIVFVDYLQLINTPADLKMMREEQVSYISRKLKECARENGIPIIALSQISRNCLRRVTDPDLSDLRESNSIAEVADLVLLLGEDKIIVAKNHHGGLGTVPVKVNSDRICLEMKRMEETTDENN